LPCKPSLPAGDTGFERIFGEGLSFVPLARRTPNARGDDAPLPQEPGLSFVPLARQTPNARGDDSPLPQELPALWAEAPEQQVVREVLNAAYREASSATFWPSRRAARQQVDSIGQEGAHLSIAAADGADFLEEYDAIDLLCGELDGVGGVATDKYYLSVCLGDRIPMETGAARVNPSRLTTVPEWREFLRKGMAGSLSEGNSLETLLQCPCCLGILRRPIGLPCGHSLCRSCLMSLPVALEERGPAAADEQRSSGRRCPLCRAGIPRVRLHVNERLDRVTEALRAFQTSQERRKTLASYARSTSREPSPVGDLSSWWSRATQHM